MGASEIFCKGGLLSQKLPGCEYRQGQLQMATAVETAIAGNKTLLVEAPCGVGKGFSYLVPAIEAAVAKQLTVLVVTGSINLQEQLITKDLPALQKVLPCKFTFALAKGMQNYICLKQYDPKASLPTPQERAQLRVIADWETKTKTGDISELDFELTPTLRQVTTVGVNSCTGPSCGDFADCYGYRARRSWNSTVVVTNYHLFYSDLEVRANNDNGTGILPDYDILIMDEGHKGPSIARDFFGFRYTERDIQYIAKSVPNSTISTLLEESGVKFFEQLKITAESPSYKARIRELNCAPEGKTTVSLLYQAADSLDSEASRASDPDIKAAIRLRSKSARETAKDLLDVLTLEDLNSVYYITVNDRTVALESKVVSPAKQLRQIFNNNKPVIVTSATLADGKSSFNHIKREYGINNCTELVVDSPFDYSRMLVVVPDMPDPRTREYPAAVSRAVVAAVTAAKGRTLALFTSWDMLETAYKSLQSARLPYKILKQGDMPRTKLIQEFRDDVNSVLLGVESFWAGIDVVGESLSCLVIDRLPFLPPNDPISDSFVERYPEAWFQMWSIPNALIQLKQGVGRLIRSTSDKGVVVLLDNRIRSKAYGKQFLRAMPPGTRFGAEIRDIEGFLNEQ